MRLIDANNLHFENQHYNKSQMKAILDFIDNQPTAYDVDKVMQQIEKKIMDDETIRFVDQAVGKAVEIAKEGGVGTDDV